MLDAQLRLIRLNQRTDTLRVRFAVTVAGDGVGSAGGFDTDFRPEHAGRNMYGGHFRHGDALFVAAEETRLHSAHALWTHDQPGGKQKVAMRPATGAERVRGPAFPTPKVAYNQDGQEKQHLDQAEQSESLELHRPRKQEDRFHIEDDKKNRDDVIPNRIAAASAVDRIDATFVRHQLGPAGVIRTHQLRRQQGYRQHHANQRNEDKNGNVVLRHRLRATLKAN